MKTSEDNAEGKPSSETLNKAEVKVRERFDLGTLFFCCYMFYLLKTLNLNKMYRL